MYTVPSRQYSSTAVHVHVHRAATASTHVHRAATDINELECLSAIYCGEVADALAHGRGEHHLYQIGDSAVYFHHVMACDKTAANGMQFLYCWWARRDEDKPRLTTRLHVTREWNTCTDALANGDIAKFRREVQWLLGLDVVYLVEA